MNRFTRNLVGFVGLAILAAVSSATRDASAQPPIKYATTIGSMQVQVVDGRSHSLAEARLHVSVWTDDKGFQPNRDYLCDAAGVANIKLPQRVQILRIWASHDSHAQMFVSLQADPKTTEFEIPTSFTFR